MSYDNKPYVTIITLPHRFVAPLLLSLQSQFHTGHLISFAGAVKFDASSLKRTSIYYISTLSSIFRKWIIADRQSYKKIVVYDNMLSGFTVIGTINALIERIVYGLIAQVRINR